MRIQLRRKWWQLDSWECTLEFYVEAAIFDRDEVLMRR